MITLRIAKLLLKKITFLQHIRMSGKNINFDDKKLIFIKTKIWKLLITLYNGEESS